jgi:microcystin-dependent protein
MSNPFLAEIDIVPFNFAPRGWAFCNGQLLPISQNTALFSLLGTTYGGNGTSNFALPNLEGSAALQQGTGPGLSPWDLGETGGEPTITLINSTLPSHTHPLMDEEGAGDQTDPTGNSFAEGKRGKFATDLYGPAPNGGSAGTSLSAAGGGQPHNNMPPYLVFSFIIAMQGIFPARS